MQVKSQLSQNMNTENNQWTGNNNNNNNIGGTQPMNYPFYNMNPISPQSSLESSIDHSSSSMNDGMMNMQDVQSSRDDFSFQPCNNNNSKKRMSYNNNYEHLGELQELALRMMRN